MERLPERLKTGEVLMASRYEGKYTANEWISVLQDRLAAYEDTGLTPEDCAEYRKFEDEIIASGKTFGRLVELLNADKEGRVVVLPYDAKDAVYGGYISDVNGACLEEAKELLAEQAAKCVKFLMLDKDVFTVDGDTVRWKLWILPEEALRRSEDER